MVSNLDFYGLALGTKSVKVSEGGIFTVWGISISLLISQIFCAQKMVNEILKQCSHFASLWYKEKELNPLFLTLPC